MRQRKYYKIKRRKKRGNVLPYIYKNKVYLGKRPQIDTGVVSQVTAHLLENAGDIIGL